MWETCQKIIFERERMRWKVNKEKYIMKTCCEEKTHMNVAHDRIHHLSLNEWCYILGFVQDIARIFQSCLLRAFRINIFVYTNDIKKHFHNDTQANTRLTYVPQCKSTNRVSPHRSSILDFCSNIVFYCFF
jgi:hypothetical protein